VSRRVLRGFNREALRKLREEASVSAAELGRRAGLGPGAISSWESGRSTPQADNLAAAMRVLGRPVEAVVDIAPEERYLGDWRVLSGLLQPQLAAAVGTATSRLAQIERGEAALPDALASRLADALGISEEQVRMAHSKARSRGWGQPV